MHVLTSSSSSNMVLALGNVPINNNDKLVTPKCTSISSASGQADELQKMLNVVVLAPSDADNKPMSKVTVPACNNELEVEMLQPSVMSDVDKLHASWPKEKTSLSDTIMEGFNTFLRDSTRKKLFTRFFFEENRN